jgi:CrcB protein
VARFLWVCLGGAAGSGARYLLAGWISARFPEFPYGTLAVNLLGSFLLGLLMHVALASAAISPTVRIALGIGVLGGFTTYSTFSYETLVLMREGALLVAGLNVLATLIGCLLACWLGLLTGRGLVGGA